jgi:hypothetical protein
MAFANDAAAARAVLGSSASCVFVEDAALDAAGGEPREDCVVVPEVIVSEGGEGILDVGADCAVVATLVWAAGELVGTILVVLASMR